MDLSEYQNQLNRDKMNAQLIDIVKSHIEKFIRLNELEDQVLKQKSKID